MKIGDSVDYTVKKMFENAMRARSYIGAIAEWQYMDLIIVKFI